MIERDGVRKVIAYDSYYLIISACCDGLDVVHDQRGQHICTPSGGYGGQGQGNCPREVIQALQSEGRVIWPR